MNKRERVILFIIIVGLAAGACYLIVERFVIKKPPQKIEFSTNDGIPQF